MQCSMDAPNCSVAFNVKDTDYFETDCSGDPSDYDTDLNLAVCKIKALREATVEDVRPSFSPQKMGSQQHL